VHGLGFESDFWGRVNGGVVHGRGFESFNFGVNGDVAHVDGFESLSFSGPMVV
jgi:hypothetical protein